MGLGGVKNFDVRERIIFLRSVGKRKIICGF